MFNGGDMDVNLLAKYPEADLSSRVILAAIEVHRHLGPGLLESAYSACLCRELETLGIIFDRERALPVTYKGLGLDCGYRMDLVIEDRLVLELKCADKILPIHEAQLLTYLKLSGIKAGLILNFNCKLMKDGIKRMVA
jgi:GxxExxY protein